VGKPGYA